MARKTSTSSSTTARKTTTTRKRGTPVPKNASVNNVAAEISNDMIARRAYEIYSSGAGGSEEDNWYQAERELRGQ